MKNADLAAVLAKVTEAEARAIFDALDQFVENGTDAEDLGDAPRGLAEAREVLDRMNAAIAAVAEN